MSNSATITITTDKTSGNLNDTFINTNPSLMMAYFQNYLSAIVSGNDAASINVKINTGNAVAASATVTVAAPISGDKLEINGVAFTAGSTFAIGASDTITATNLKTAINASANALISGLVTATSDGATVTIAASTPGVAGNMITVEGKGTGGLDPTGSGTHASATLTSVSAIATDTVVTNGVTVTAVDKKEKTQVTAIADTGALEISDITCVADTASSLNSTYFTFSALNTAGVNTNFYVWFNVGGAGVDPAVGGATGIPVAFAANTTDANVALAIRTAIPLFAAANALVTVTGATTHVILTAKFVGNPTSTANGGASPGFSYSNTNGAASNLNSKYFVFYSAVDATKYYMWYNVNGQGVDPAVAASTGVVIAVAAGAAANTVASTSRTAFLSAPLSADFTETGATDKILFRNKLPGLTTDAVDTGSTGFTFSVTIAGATVGATEFQIGDTNALTATAIAASMNAQASLSPIIIATAASNVVTVTAQEEGIEGNNITLSTTGGTITASGSRLSGGTDSGLIRLASGTNDSGSSNYSFFR